MQFARFRLSAVLVAAAILAVVGCSSEGPDSATDSDGGTDSTVGTPTDTAAALADREFLLESSEGFEPVEGTTVRLSFRDGEMGFSAGCNHHDGAYTLCDGSLCVEGMMSTEMGCSADRHQQDEWLAAFFLASPTLELEGDTLTLTTADATLVFLDREVADPDRPLSGNTWTIDTFIQGEAAMNLALNEVPTVTFGDDGSVQVFTSCNTGQGSYAANGNVVVLSGMSYTEVACSDANSTEADTHIRAVLADGEVTTEIEAAHLTVTRGSLGIGATTD
jgi:heat shock protein HslJ